MMIFCHLFTAILLGWTVARVMNERAVFLPIVIGGILPDVLDKPIGHLLLSGVVDYGRIFTHGILAFLLPMMIAGVIGRRDYRLALLGMGVGILLHQALDLMWLEPISWLFPFLGPYELHHMPDFFEVALWNEVRSPSEWLFLLLSISSLNLLLGGGRSGVTRTIEGLSLTVMRYAPAALLLLALVIAILLPIGSFHASGYDDTGSRVLLASVCLLSAITLWRTPIGPLGRRHLTR